MPYQQIIEGEWLLWHKEERWACCDCGLVHRVEVRTKNGQLQLRMYRENRATGQIRRREGIKLHVQKRKSRKRATE